MSDEARIRNQIKNLEAIRTASLGDARQKRGDADRVAAKRNNPPNDLRAYEHQRECDEKAARLRRDADSADRNAERLLKEINGLKSYLK